MGLNLVNVMNVDNVDEWGQCGQWVNVYMVKRKSNRRVSGDLVLAL